MKFPYVRVTGGMGHSSGIAGAESTASETTSLWRRFHQLRLLRRVSMFHLHSEALEPFGARRATSWVRILLLLLLCEKVIQHGAVTLAFAFDLAHLRAHVAVDYRLLLFVGAALTVLFAVCIWGLLQPRRWVRGVVVALAFVDIVGEFFAQGIVLITVTVSFVVAIVLLLLAALYREGRSGQASCHPRLQRFY